MLKSKRRPQTGGYLEPWLDFRIRSLSTAKRIVRRQGICVLETLFNKKSKWAEHIARFGIDHRDPHPLKALLAWRCTSWWHDQALFNDLDWDPKRHHPGIGRPRRWEAQFSSNWLHALS